VAVDTEAGVITCGTITLPLVDFGSASIGGVPVRQGEPAWWMLVGRDVLGGGGR
jgi:hypothetical protein